MPVITTSPGCILHETGSSEFFGAGVGNLSIKTFIGGQARYAVGNKRYLVGHQTHLILNHGQSYTVEIDATTPVESFCVFFAEGFAAEVQRSLLTLPAPAENQQGKHSLDFFEKTYHHDDLLTPAILRLRAGIESRRVTTGWLEEHLHGLMQRLLHLHYNVYHEVEQLPARRPATREALFRQLHAARDYAIASFSLPLTLADMARVACLSPNHLMRSFKQAFGQTPHHFVTSCRLEESQRLLLHSEQTVTDICFAVGFESLGTFSWLFRQRFGLSPTQFRRKKGGFGEAVSPDDAYNETINHHP
jgi:AraC-like DNA-binding protein